MKLYIITRAGSPAIHKLEEWVDYERTSNNTINIVSVKAFTKLQYAKAFLEDLEEKGYKNLIIRSLNI